MDFIVDIDHNDGDVGMKLPTQFSYSISTCGKLHCWFKSLQKFNKYQRHVETIKWNKFIMKNMKQYPILSIFDYL